VQDTAGQTVDQVNQTTEDLSPGLQEVGQQTQVAVDQATGQVESVAQGAQDTAEQAQGTAAGAAQQTQDTAEQTAQHVGEAQEAAGQQQPGATSAASQKAEELGVDLTQVKGTGSGGLITLQDVTSAAKRG